MRWPSSDGCDAFGRHHHGLCDPAGEADGLPARTAYDEVADPDAGSFETRRCLQPRAVSSTKKRLQPPPGRLETCAIQTERWHRQTGDRCSSGSQETRLLLAAGAVRRGPLHYQFFGLKNHHHLSVRWLNCRLHCPSSHRRVASRQPSGTCGYG
jgi:hypothetical protein